MHPEPPIPDPKRIPLRVEELIRAGEKLFKKARQINDKYEAVIEQQKPALKDEPKAPRDR
jgi:hypothetical protein